MLTSLNLRPDRPTVPVRFECPDAWIDAWRESIVSGAPVTLTCDELTISESELVVADALAADADLGTRELDTALTDVVRGDRLLVNDEQVRVWDNDAGEIVLVDDLHDDHLSASPVTVLHVTVKISTADMVVGESYRFVWSLEDDRAVSVTQSITCADEQHAPAGLWVDVLTRWPVIGQLVDVERREMLSAILQDDYRTELYSVGINVDRIVDQPLYRSGLHLYVRYSVLGGGGDAWQYEYETAREEWRGWVDRVRALPIWQDHNHNGKVDPGETAQARGVFIQERDW